MHSNPTYEELQQKIRKLENEIAERDRRGNGNISKQKNSYEGVERERDLLQTVMNCAKNSHLVFLDRDFNFVRVNTAYADSCGYRPEEMIGKNHFKLYPHPENEAIFTKVRDSGEPFEIKNKPFDFPDQPDRGTTYWDWTLIPVKDNVGYVTGLVFSLFETTGRKHTEEALRKNEAKMRSIFLAAPVSIGVMVNRVFQEVNARFCEISGYNQDELIGNTSRMLYPSDEDYERVDAEKYRQIGQTGTGAVETRFKRKDGSTVDVLVSSAPLDPDDLSTGVTIIALDITERKIAEKALRKNEQAFRNLFDHHAAVKIIIDPDTGRIIAANHAAEAFYGWSCTTLTEMNIAQINIKSPDEIKNSMEHAKNQKRIHFDFQHRLADGSIRDVEVFSSGVEMGGRKYLHSIIHDITEQKKAKKEMEELQIQNWQLKKAESLSRLAGAIAHHFNNNLMAIMGNLDLGLQVIKQDEPPFEYLTEAMKVTQKAANVSSLMLTYLGRNTSGKMPMDIGKVCRMSIPLLQATLPFNVFLEADFPIHSPMVYGNANQIQQLVTNLVANAAESYEEEKEGFVYLTLRLVRAREIPKQNRFPINWIPDHDDYACLTVTDSGCGIKEQNIEKIFDPFFSTKFAGRGLDLAVVLGIVKANNGVITVESKWGEGSTFRFFIPIMTEPISEQPD